MTHAHQKTLWEDIRWPLALGAMLVGVLVVFSVLAGSQQASFVSSEVKFTDASANGLAIMPASCASTPSREVCRNVITAVCRTIDLGEECNGVGPSGVVQIGTEQDPEGGWQPRHETVCTTFSAGPTPHDGEICDPL